MSNIKLYNYLKINDIIIDSKLILFKADVLKQIVKVYKMKKQKIANKKYRLAHPEKAKEISKNQAYKKYHNDTEYRLSKIENEKIKYRVRKHKYRMEAKLQQTL